MHHYDGIHYTPPPSLPECTEHHPLAATAAAPIYSVALAHIPGAGSRGVPAVGRSRVSDVIINLVTFL